MVSEPSSVAKSVFGTLPVITAGLSRLAHILWVVVIIECFDCMFEVSAWVAAVEQALRLRSVEAAGLPSCSLLSGHILLSVRFSSGARGSQAKPGGMN